MLGRSLTHWHINEMIDAMRGHVDAQSGEQQPDERVDISQDEEKNSEATKKRSDLYDRLRQEQLAQIEKAVAGGEYSLVMSNVTQDAQNLLLSYGYRETNCEWSDTRWSARTYKFAVDSFEQPTDQATQHYKDGVGAGVMTTLCCLAGGYLCAHCLCH